MLERISRGRTDLVFDFLASGQPARSTDANGTTLIQWCAHYGDVSAVRHLLAHGESLRTLGDNYDLNAAAFHGHWQLCQFLIENGADANQPMAITGESPLHAALCTAVRLKHDRVIQVLLASGASPKCATKPSAVTGCFMRDCRTRAETPLHRAAAFGTERTIRMLLEIQTAWRGIWLGNRDWWRNACCHQSSSRSRQTLGDRPKKTETLASSATVKRASL